MVRLAGELGWDEVLEAILADALKKWIADELLRRKMVPVTEFVVRLDESDAKRMGVFAKRRLRVDMVGFSGMMLFSFNPSIGFLVEVDSPWNSVLQVASNTEKLKLLSDCYGCSALQVCIKKPVAVAGVRFNEAYRRFDDEFSSHFDMRGFYEDVTYRKFSNSQLVFHNPIVELEALFEVYAKRVRKIALPRKSVLWWLNYLLDGNFLSYGLGGYNDKKLIDSYLDLWGLKRSYFFRKDLIHPKRSSHGKG